MMRCPKCQNAMTKGQLNMRGIVLDTFSTWTEGRPKHAVQVRIDAYRCADCGFVEFYATKSKTGPNEKRLNRSLYSQGGI